MSSPCLSLASPNATPFLITVQEAILLEESEGFGIIREHLAQNSCNTFCQAHITEDSEERQSWIVMRDILHALLAPIVALENHATKIARKYATVEGLEDIEHALKGRGRNAFVWLQSFLASDEDWCLSRACPACVVQHSIDAEFQLRLLIAACMLSDVQGPGPECGPALPSFAFLLRAINEALDEDELWGSDFWAYIEPKANDLNIGMQDLMRQCERLEASMSPPTSPEASVLPSFSYFSDRRGSLRSSSKTVYPRFESAVMGVKPSRLAKAQMKMAREEEAWLQRLALTNWQNMSAARIELVGGA